LPLLPALICFDLQQTVPKGTLGILH